MKDTFSYYGKYRPNFSNKTYKPRVNAIKKGISL